MGAPDQGATQVRPYCSTVRRRRYTLVAGRVSRLSANGARSSVGALRVGHEGKIRDPPVLPALSEGETALVGVGLCLCPETSKAILLGV